MVTVLTSGKMPRSSATFNEYQQFLQRYYYSYLRFKNSEHGAQDKNFKKIETILERLALSCHVENPKDVAWQHAPDESLDKLGFASSDEARKQLVDFYSIYRIAIWNKRDEADIEALSAIVWQEQMVFRNAA